MTSLVDKWFSDEARFQPVFMLSMLKADVLHMSYNEQVITALNHRYGAYVLFTLVQSKRLMNLENPSQRTA